MFVNDVFNKEELSALIISELKHLGVKYRKEKKNKFPQEKCGRKRIFRVHLHQLELTDVLLTNGCIVQIPSFVSIACQRICEQIETEGLFRKTGSHLRQKEIKVNLENGLPLGTNYHVIDIANVLKSFLRELPEPLLPPHLQEVLLRGFLLAEGKLKAMLLGCLLLPPLTLNTLTFFMQFLKKVSNFSDQNKMTVSNLAIIFTPGLMPLDDINSIRFNNHVKIVQFLIQNAESIGILPNDIACKLSAHTTPVKPILEQSVLLNVTDKKKKKRRSGSLNRMFNGIKKIVGAISSSSENLESTPENTIINTPCITKSNKKRKMVEAVSGFSTKKKKEFLNLFPDGNILPNTPMCMKESKKGKVLSGRKNIKHKSIDNQSSLAASIERRWSVVGSAWTRKKNINNDLSKKQNLKVLSPVISLPNIPDIDFPQLELEQQSSLNESNSNQSMEITSTHSLNDENKSIDSIDYVRVPKCEYEAIKERVESIEKRISQEFSLVQKTLIFNENSSENNFSQSSTSFDIDMSGPEKVLDKFEKTVEETVNIISPTTDQLAKRLSRDLKIRRSAEQRVIRSPSARKIGSMRRRSRELVRLSRNATWHISSTKSSDLKNQIITTSNGGISFYPRNSSNLKRGRPNTIQTGLHTPGNIGTLAVDAKEGNEMINFQTEYPALQNAEIIKQNVTSDELKMSENNNFINTNQENNMEQWVDGEAFFDNDGFPQTPKNRDNSEIFTTPSARPSRKKSITPIFATPVAKIESDIKTPMLPPRTIPRKTGKTPGSLSHKKISDSSGSKCNLISPLKDENPTGRASIARLRALNAGMVLAKAKLFNDLDHHQAQITLQLVKAYDVPATDNRRQSSRFAVKKFEQIAEYNEKSNQIMQKLAGKENSTHQNRTPRRKGTPKSPGCIQKRKKLSLSKYPDKRLLENVIQLPCTVLNENMKHTLIKKMEKSAVRHSPRKSTTPRIKKSLMNVNTPLKYITTPKLSESSIRNNRTPLRATPVLGLRQSPRLQQHNKKICNV